jgi:putative ABC transport system permease protein
MWNGNFKTAINTLRASKWRSTFTMLGIIIGITSVVTVVSLGQGLKQQIVGQINNLGSDVITVRPGKLLSTDGKGLNFYAFLTPSTLTESDLGSIQNMPGVSAAAPIEFIGSAVSSDDQHHLDDAFVAGTTPRLNDILRQKIDYGDFFTTDDPTQNFAVIGSRVAHSLFGELNPVGQTIHIAGQDFIVHAVLARSSTGVLSVTQSDYNSTVFVPTAAAHLITGNHSNILQILVKANNVKNIDAVSNGINAALMKNHQQVENFTVLKQYQLLGITNNIVSTITVFTTALAAISLLVGGIGIMDIMLVSVSERTREIGIRKAIGATNRQILNQFLVEGLALTITGGIIGTILSLAINFGLRIYTSLHPVISVPVLLLAVGTSVVVGLVFSAAPALKAARKDPITALRGA